MIRRGVYHPNMTGTRKHGESLTVLRLEHQRYFVELCILLHSFEVAFTYLLFSVTNPRETFILRHQVLVSFNGLAVSKGSSGTSRLPQSCRQARTAAICVTLRKSR